MTWGRVALQRTLLFSLGLGAAWPAQALRRESLTRWLAATRRSLDCMRDPSGLVVDAVELVPAPGERCPFRALNPATSPTNIGLDILIRLEAKEDVSDTITALEKMPRDLATGLYYNWYETQEPFRVRYHYLSSIDNFHLALALWTAARVSPSFELRARAERLWRGMNFAPFLEWTGRVRGGLSENWTFGHFGSEARTLYSVAWAIGLYGRAQSPGEREQSFDNVMFEEVDLGASGRSLAVWDGGAFQLLLPELLAGESQFSERFAASFRNYASFVRAESERRGLPVPAAHSASQFGLRDRPGAPGYNGKAGSLGLTTIHNDERLRPGLRVLWEAVFTPHAAILTLPFSDALRAGLEGAEGIPGLYNERVGWADGYWVEAPFRGEVVPVQLALDQGMIALALQKALSRDGRSVSERALHADPAIRSELAGFYRAFEARLVR